MLLNQIHHLESSRHLLITLAAVCAFTFGVFLLAPASSGLGETNLQTSFRTSPSERLYNGENSQPKVAVYGQDDADFGKDDVSLPVKEKEPLKINYHPDKFDKGKIGHFKETYGMDKSLTDMDGDKDDIHDHDMDDIPSGADLRKEMGFHNDQVEALTKNPKIETSHGEKNKYKTPVHEITHIDVEKDKQDSKLELNVNDNDATHTHEHKPKLETVGGYETNKDKKFSIESDGKLDYENGNEYNGKSDVEDVKTKDKIAGDGPGYNVVKNDKKIDDKVNHIISYGNKVFDDGDDHAVADKSKSVGDVKAIGKQNQDVYSKMHEMEMDEVKNDAIQVVKSNSKPHNGAITSSDVAKIDQTLSNKVEDGKTSIDNDKGNNKLDTIKSYGGKSYGGALDDDAREYEDQTKTSKGYGDEVVHKHEFEA